MGEGVGRGKRVPATRARGCREILVHIEERGARNVPREVELASLPGRAQLPATVDELVAQSVSLRVTACPGERVVRDLFPAVLAREMAPARVLLELGRSRSPALLLPVGSVDRGRADAVLGARDEEQRRSVGIPV